MAVMVIDRTSEDNKYLHRDFHLIFNRGLDHIGENYGEDGVIDYIKAYAKNYFSKMTLEEIANYFKDIYEREEASDRLTLDLSDKALTVKISKCPAVEYIFASGDKPSKYYVHTTKTLYAEIAAISGLKFELASYDDATGAAEFTFKKSCGRCCKKKA
jgi:hypothetical protein